MLRILVISAMLAMAATTSADTVNNFAGGGTAYTIAAFTGATPSVVPGSAGFSPVLVLAQGANGDNSIAFDQTDSWTTGGVYATFSVDTNSPTSSGDVLSFVLLNSAIYGSSGAGPDVDLNNLPAVQNSLVVSINPGAATISADFAATPATDPQQRGQQILNSITGQIQSVQLLINRARNSGDVLLVQALTDSLKNLQAAQQLAKSNVQDLNAAVTRGDNDAVATSLRALELINKNAIQSFNEAKSTVGGPDLTPGTDRKIEIDTSLSDDGAGSDVRIYELDATGPNLLLDEEIGNLFPHDARVEFDGQSSGAGDQIGVDDVSAKFNVVPEPGAAVGGAVLLVGLAGRMKRR